MNRQGTHDQHSASPPGVRAATLDELSALCEQMVSLSKAGVPLDRGLIQLAEDMPPRLREQASHVGQQLQAGTSLADAVASDDSPFPAVYKSVVEAGLRSGNLTVALQGFARLAGQLTEVRRLVLSALVYPMLLLVLLWIIASSLLPRLGFYMAEGLSDLRGPRNQDVWLNQWFDWYIVATQWFWVLPVVLYVLGMAWFAVAFLAKATGKRSHWMHWIPGTGRLLRNSHLLAFTDVLGLLVQQRVPLHQSLRLAGSASGDHHLEADALALADEIAKGARSDVPENDTPIHPQGIPALLRWSLLNSQQLGPLESLLHRASQTYRRRTETSAQWLRRSLPIIFSVTLGGIVSCLYAALVFAPWYAMLRSLSASMESM